MEELEHGSPVVGPSSDPPTAVGGSSATVDPADHRDVFVQGDGALLLESESTAQQDPTRSAQGSHRHPGRPDPPQWIIVTHDDELSRRQYAEHLSAMGQALNAGSLLEIERTRIRVPDSVEFELKFERTPHGTYALMIRAEWPGDRVEAVPQSTARDPVIRAPESQ